MIHHNTIPDSGIFKYLYNPHEVIFFPISVNHRYMAEHFDMKPTAAGVIALGVTQFKLTNKRSESLQIGTNREAVIGLEAFLGRVCR